MTADPEKCFQEFISEKFLILLRDGPCLELFIVSSNFQALLFLQDKLLESVTAINSSKKVLKITGPALSGINSVRMSARTVMWIEFMLGEVSINLTRKVPYRPHPDPTQL